MYVISKLKLPVLKLVGSRVLLHHEHGRGNQIQSRISLMDPVNTFSKTIRTTTFSSKFFFSWMSVSALIQHSSSSPGKNQPWKNTFSDPIAHPSEGKYCIFLNYQSIFYIIQDDPLVNRFKIYIFLLMCVRAFVSAHLDNKCIKNIKESFTGYNLWALLPFFTSCHEILP